MDPINYGYSVKNIPIPTKDQYLFALIKKTESFIKWLRWTAFFFLLRFKNTDKNETDGNKYNLKTNRCPPTIDELKAFENDLWNVVENVELGDIQDPFQSKLASDVQKINKSDKIIIAGDKTSNYYETPKVDYKRTVLNGVTKSYKKCEPSVPTAINNEAKNIATKLNIEKRVNTITEQQCFVTIKDHKDDFRTNPKYRLINPTKSEIGKISKAILDKINSKIRHITKTNQWQSTSDAIKWFKNIEMKNECTFVIFDISEFYPSISKQLLLNSINFAKQYTTISDDDINIIMHARKALLYNDSQPWIKRHGDSDFDVTMGSHDGAELSELTGAYLLSQLHEVVPKEDIGLYRDDGLGVLRNINGQRGEQVRKQFIEIFKRNNLKIEIKLSKTADFLDITFDLNQNIYKTYRKPNSETLYVNKRSNHPITILKQIPKSISKRISENSSNKQIFDETAVYYNDILKKSGYEERLEYIENTPNEKQARRRRKIIWYNPPFSKNVKTKIGLKFINLIDKHFGNKDNVLNKIFNRNTIKISYSCMTNIGNIIKAHNTKILNNDNRPKAKTCNCQRRNDCPLDGQCCTNNVIYTAKVTVHESNQENNSSNQETSTELRRKSQRTINNQLPNKTNPEPTPNDPLDKDSDPTTIKKEMFYIGAAETFKLRYANHLKSFRHEQYKKETALSKYIWTLKSKNLNFSINWKILRKTSGYNKVSKSCNLCTSEKLEICKFKHKNILLNQRNELVSKCRHENRHLLANFTG